MLAPVLAVLFVLSALVLDWLGGRKVMWLGAPVVVVALVAFVHFGCDQTSASLQTLL